MLASYFSLAANRHSECNLNRKLKQKLALIPFTTPGGYMGWKLVIYWKPFVCVCTKGLHLIKRHFWEAGCCLAGHQFWNQHQHLIGRKRACVFCLLGEDLLGSHHLLSDHFLLSPHLTWPNGWGRWTHCAGG